MIHILFMILKALGILLLVLLFLVLLIVCTVLFLPFCYRAQVLKEEEGFACVKASGRVSWLFGAVALTASYEEQKPEAQILLFGASLETWKRRLKKIRRGEASVPRTEENETENAPEAEKTAEQKAEAKKEQTSAEQPAEQKTDTVEKQMPQRDAEKTQKAPDQTEKQQKVTAQKEQPEQRQEPDAPKKSILERFFGRIEYLPEKLLNLASRLLQTAFRLLELPFRLLEKLEQKIQAGRRLKRKWESVKKYTIIDRLQNINCGESNSSSSARQLRYNIFCLPLVVSRIISLSFPCAIIISSTQTASNVPSFRKKI